MVAQRDDAQSAASEQLKYGRTQFEAVIEMQKEVLETYERISHEWLDRVKSEGELWNEMAKNISAAKSVPDTLAAFQECATKRMQMAADDGRRILNGGQAMASAFTRTVGNNWPTTGST